MAYTLACGANAFTVLPSNTVDFPWKLPISTIFPAGEKLLQVLMVNGEQQIGFPSSSQPSIFLKLLIRARGWEQIRAGNFFRPMLRQAISCLMLRQAISRPIFFAGGILVKSFPHMLA